MSEKSSLRCAVLILAAAAAAVAQELSVGSILPPRCNPGDIFVLTTAPRGQNVYVGLGSECVLQTGSGSGSGDVQGPAASVDNEVALFNATTGKLIKRATLTGIPKLTSGVLSTAVAGADYIAATTGTAIQKASAGGLAAAVAGTDYSPPLSTTVPSLTVNAGTGAITPATGYVNDIQTVVVNVSSAEVLALFTTPKTLVAAPGANKQIVPLHIIVEYDYNSTTYAGTLFLGIGSSAASGYGVMALSCVGAGNNILTRTADAFCQIGATLGGGGASIGDLKSVIDWTNKPLTFAASTSNPTTGNGTFRITLTYRVIDTLL
jgi:hypothetical protein